MNLVELVNHLLVVGPYNQPLHLQHRKRPHPSFDEEDTGNSIPKGPEQGMEEEGPIEDDNPEEEPIEDKDPKEEPIKDKDPEEKLLEVEDPEEEPKEDENPEEETMEDKDLRRNLGRMRTLRD